MKIGKLIEFCSNKKLAVLNFLKFDLSFLAYFSNVKGVTFIQSLDRKLKRHTLKAYAFLSRICEFLTNKNAFQ